MTSTGDVHATAEVGSSVALPLQRHPHSFISFISVPVKSRTVVFMTCPFALSSLLFGFVVQKTNHG
jgi:hypothetical protein